MSLIDRVTANPIVGLTTAAALLASTFAVSAIANAAIDRTQQRVEQYPTVTSTVLIPGPKGDKGDTGSPGTNGIDGRNGIDGTNGPAGINGNDGVNGTSGTNGTNGKDGQRGPKGDTGNQGPKGDKGDTGNTGPAGINGKDGNPGPLCPTGYSSATIDVHQRNPEGTTSILTCVLETTAP